MANDSLVVFIYTSVSNTAEASVLHQEQLEIIKKDFSSGVIEKSFFVTAKRQLHSSLNDAISFSRHCGALLLFGQFAPFQRDLNVLQILQREKIHFKFYDLPIISKGKTLQCIIEYLEYTKRIKGGKISARIKERRESGKKQGLAHLQKKKLNEVISIASYAKKLNTRVDDLTIDARKLIFRLKEKELYSYRKIADELNARGFKTAKGSSFGPKTIERMYKIQLDFKDNIETEKKLSLKAAAPMKSDKGSFKIQGFKRFQNFEEVLSFTLTNVPPTGELTLFILDNKGEIIHSQTHPKSQKDVYIELKKLRKLFPGLYYLNLKSTNRKVKDFVREFYFYKNVLPLEE